MSLRASLGQALMFTRGNSEQVRTAFLRALTMAEQLDDIPYQLQLLGNLHILHERMGDFHGALPFAERGLAVAQAHGDKGAVAAAHSFLGISCHLMGDHDAAHRHLLAGLSEAQVQAGVHFGFDNRSRTRITMARGLFLRGFADQAVRMAQDTVEEAATLEHPVTLCMALIWAVSVHIWTGDLNRAEEAVGRFAAHAERHSLGPYLAVGSGVKGVLAIRRGAVDAGIAAVRRALETLHADRYELLTAQFLGAVAAGLATAGRSGEALEAVDEVIALVDRRGDTFLMPDLLRIKAEALAGQSDRAGAELVLEQALAMSRKQGTLAWELRVATRLAGLWAERSRSNEARDLLGPLYERFTEGFETADLVAARALLDVLSRGLTS
jgi:tetratricopeptide (TPR) repeat protein